MGKIEQRLQELGIELPELPNSLGNYLPSNRVGNLVYTSGQGSRNIHGKVGGDLSVEDGYAAAREAALPNLPAGPTRDTRQSGKGLQSTGLHS